MIWLACMDQIENVCTFRMWLNPEFHATDFRGNWQ